MKNLIKKVTTGGFILVGLSSNIFAAPTKSAVLRCDYSNFRKYIYDKKKIKGLIKKIGRGCQLAKANLKEANLKGAFLKGTNLEGAFLKGANLQGAFLEGAFLKGANLQGAFLKGANLQGAFLKGANLGEANLKWAFLRGANLGEANLQGANLKEALLKGANLKGANLQGAFLYGASLQRANLKEANLKGANLKRANLKGANLRGANLKGAIYDDTTTFSFWFSRVGKGLLKDVPCSVGVGEEPDNLSLWEQFIGIENRPPDSYGERKCAQEESGVSVNNDGQRKSGKEVEEDSESSDDTPTGVLQ